jgi:hypothetical protein
MMARWQAASLSTNADTSVQNSTSEPTDCTVSP